MKANLENFNCPKIFYDFLMVKILKKIFLINEELNQKSPLIQKIVHRVFGSRSGNLEVVRGLVQPQEPEIDNKRSTVYQINYRYLNGELTT